MKKLLYILSAAILFTACKKDTAKIFDETPEERMSARIDELKTALVGSEHGWTAFLSTTGSGGYGFYMDFEPSQSLVMVADLNDESATNANTSTFRIKWVMNATLIFDTYNYITMLQDPVPSVYGGVAGSGMKSDVEFEFIRMNGDTIVMKGFKYKNDLILVKATAVQKTRYLSSAFKANIDDITSFFVTKQNNYFNINGITNQIEFVLDKSGKTAKFQYLNDNGNVTQTTAKYSYVDDGILFDDGFTVNGVVFIRGKIENGEFVLYAADGTKYTLKQNAIPVLPMPLLFAYNGTYRELYIGSNLPAGVTSGFNTAYNGCVAKFAAMSPKRTLVDVRFVLTNSTTATVITRNNNGTSTFIANATFQYVYNNGIITLSNPTYDGNWTARTAQLIDIQNYFATGGPFKVDYVQSTNPGVTNLGGLYRVSDNTSFFYGTLRK
ncbi:DUF4302 domain-containing protein [Niastella populi]|uniref:DUF4302 domain-containing protein n=1 Tax=Niastella populi TaxID=550983 RepID=A0A1V9FKT4_9BACT|nr:DUF4302 domain-containing protein [Niastella populi]OQP58989.1 hypothetical protein A4R26_21610 [Niastella populi]